MPSPNSHKKQLCADPSTTLGNPVREDTILGKKARETLQFDGKTDAYDAVSILRASRFQKLVK
jgi:hypothetical protein